tara:strand:- start:18869 stop:19885 length:1017 start_codon:yes stop_codon:yes gene_type:complete
LEALLAGGEEDKMNLRITLILIILLSWFSVLGVLIFQSDIGEEKEEVDISYFYRISSGDIRNISITNNSKKLSWHLQDNIWYFDQLNGIPADSYRWGGIIDLLQGPKLYRTISENIDDKAKYGLDNPATEISIFLDSGDKRTLFIGNETPDLTNNYAYLEGDEKLVMVDATWKNVLTRLVEEPPYPKWMNKINTEEVVEVVLINNGEIIKAFSKKGTDWFACYIPLSSSPCLGDEKVKPEPILNFLIDFSDLNILNSVQLNMMFAEDYSKYGLGLDAPYVDIKTISRDQFGVNTLYNTSISIGNLNEEDTGYFAVAAETKDVILIEKEWADKILSFFK